MTYYKKKPVTVEAIQCGEAVKFAKSDWHSLPKWMKDACSADVVVFAGDRLCIKTLEGIMIAEPADMVIRGIQGEIYPCKPDIFSATYDRL